MSASDEVELSLATELCSHAISIPYKALRRVSGLLATSDIANLVDRTCMRTSMPLYSELISKHDVELQISILAQLTGHQNEIRWGHADAELTSWLKTTAPREYYSVLRSAPKRRINSSTEETDRHLGAMRRVSEALDAQMMVTKQGANGGILAIWGPDPADGELKIGFGSIAAQLVLVSTIGADGCNLVSRSVPDREKLREHLVAAKGWKARLMGSVQLWNAEAKGAPPSFDRLVLSKGDESFKDAASRGNVSGLAIGMKSMTLRRSADALRVFMKGWGDEPYRDVLYKPDRAMVPASLLFETLPVDLERDLCLIFASVDVTEALTNVSSLQKSIDEDHKLFLLVIRNSLDDIIASLNDEDRLNDEEEVFNNVISSFPLVKKLFGDKEVNNKMFKTAADLWLSVLDFGNIKSVPPPAKFPNTLAEILRLMYKNGIPHDGEAVIEFSFFGWRSAEIYKRLWPSLSKGFVADEGVKISSEESDMFS